MTTAKSGGVQSVARALRLLTLLGQSEDGQRVSDLAHSAGLAVSTTHRLLTTLELQGFAQFNAANSLWHVGRQAYTVGAAFGRRRNFVAPALPLLRRMRDVTHETANLGILEDDQLITLSQVESREIMRAISPPGGQVHAFCSGMGKAILATWSDRDIKAFAQRVGFRPLTQKSHTSIETFMADIEDVRRQGYALDDEEYIPGLRCVAAAVFSPQGEAICAVSVSGLAVRLSPEKLPVVGQHVAQTANDLTRTLGGDLEAPNGAPTS